MKVMMTTLKVRRFYHRESYEGYQTLCKEYRLFGIPLWSREIDREEVPSWANIQRATLGSTDWRSKFADIIDANNS